MRFNRARGDFPVHLSDRSIGNIPTRVQKTSYLTTLLDLDIVFPTWCTTCISIFTEHDYRHTGNYRPLHKTITSRKSPYTSNMKLNDTHIGCFLILLHICTFFQLRIDVNLEYNFIQRHFCIQTHVMKHTFPTCQYTPFLKVTSHFRLT